MITICVVIGATGSKDVGKNIFGRLGFFERRSWDIVGSLMMNTGFEGGWNSFRIL
jgi:hypothetical protein